MDELSQIKPQETEGKKEDSFVESSQVLTEEKKQKEVEEFLATLLRKKEDLYLRQESILEKQNCLLAAKNQVSNANADNPMKDTFLEDIKASQEELTSAMNECEAAHKGIASVTIDLQVTDRTRNYADALRSTSFEDFKSAKKLIERKEITQNESALSIVALCDNIIESVDKILRKTDVLLQKINSWQEEMQQEAQEANNKKEVENLIDEEILDEENVSLLSELDELKSFDASEEDIEDEPQLKNGEEVLSVDQLKNKVLTLDSIQENLENGNNKLKQ